MSDIYSRGQKQQEIDIERNYKGAEADYKRFLTSPEHYQQQFLINAASTIVGHLSDVEKRDWSIKHMDEVIQAGDFDNPAKTPKQIKKMGFKTSGDFMRYQLTSPGGATNFVQAYNALADYEAALAHVAAIRERIAQDKATGQEVKLYTRLQENEKIAYKLLSFKSREDFEPGEKGDIQWRNFMTLNPTMVKGPDYMNRIKANQLDRANIIKQLGGAYDGSLPLIDYNTLNQPTKPGVAVPTKTMPSRPGGNPNIGAPTSGVKSPSNPTGGAIAPKQGKSPLFTPFGYFFSGGQ